MLARFFSIAMLFGLMAWSPEALAGWCKAQAPQNACGYCRTDADCGGERGSCWAQKSGACKDGRVPARPTFKGWCKAQAPVNACGRCNTDADCGGMRSSCWSQRSSACLSDGANTTSASVFPKQPGVRDGVKAYRQLRVCNSSTDVFGTSIRFAGTNYWAQVQVGARSSDIEIYDLDRSRFRSISNRYASNNVPWRRMTASERSTGLQVAKNPRACLVRGKTSVGSAFTCWTNRGEPICR